MRGTVEHSSFELPPDRPARIVVVADSHSSPHPQAYSWIARERPDVIFHAGDIGRLGVLDELDAIAPTFAVRGNIDGRDPRTPDSRVLDVTSNGERRLRVLLTHIAVYGPRLQKDARQLARANQADLVICGHSHVPLIAQDGSMVVFNPGSLGPRRFHLPITFGAFDVAQQVDRLRHIDCESGEVWLPPALAD